MKKMLKNKIKRIKGKMNRFIQGVMNAYFKVKGKTKNSKGWRKQKTACLCLFDLCHHITSHHVTTHHITSQNLMMWSIGCSQPYTCLIAQPYTCLKVG